VGVFGIGMLEAFAGAPAAALLWGRGLLPGPARPAVQDIVCFNDTAITTQLAVLSAWAAAGVTAIALTRFIHPPAPRTTALRPEVEDPEALARSTPAPGGVLS